MNHIQKLQESYSRVTLIPVVGSGLSVPFGLPDWRTLIELAGAHFSLSDIGRMKLTAHLDKLQYLDAVDILLEEGVSEPDLQSYIADCMLEAKTAAADQTNSYTDLARMAKVRFITTNYDRYLNDLVGANTFLLEQLEDIPVNQFGLPDYDHTVIPLHGEITRPESLVFTRTSYDRLYNSSRFCEEFQQLRTHFTFLFIGFSFDDQYVQRLFERVLQRFEAQHFIMLDQRIDERDREKVERLRVKYGLETIYYDASVDGHTRAISRRLADIFNLRDADVDLTGMEKLPERDEQKLAPDEEKTVQQGHRLIEEEQLSELYALYSPYYTDSALRTHTVMFQIEIMCGLLWYWGFQLNEERSEELIRQVQENPVLSEYQKKLAIMYGQYLWNSRQFTRGISILQAYTGAEERLVGLLLDIHLVSQRFLPERDEVGGEIPVYEQEPRTDAEKAAYRAAYEELRGKYVNPETYNLRNIKAYADRESERIAYYWLGIVAGQLFHEHTDAIQYLLRAYELGQNLATCELLAQNYYELAIDKTRYREDAKKYQLDMGSLLKAKIRFQYMLNFSDPAVIQSVFQRSGYMYLDTLYKLKDFLAFYEAWDKGSKYIPETGELSFLKAQADAEYQHTVSEELLDKLEEKDRGFIRYYCMMNRAGFFDGVNPNEAQRLRLEILQHADEEAPLEDSRIIRIVLDTALFLKETAYYEGMKRFYPEKYFDEMKQLGFEDELYGRIDDAEAKLRAVYDTHKDYGGSFQLLRGFYLRHQKREAYNKLMDEVTEEPPDELYRQPDFFAGRVMTEEGGWRDPWGALAAYGRYYERIKEDVFLQKQVEENLKYHAADYSDWEDRVAWNRIQLTKAPKQEKYSVYRLILGLYLANARYEEAWEVIKEMAREGVPQLESLDRLTLVCLGEQCRECYLGRELYYSSSPGYLNAQLSEARGHVRYLQPKLGAAGEKLILTMPQLLCVFSEGRQAELEQIKEIRLLYAGMVRLQNSLWCIEDPFLRNVLQWIREAENVQISAPSFLAVCRRAEEIVQKNRDLEQIQLELFHGENPDCLTL